MSDPELYYATLRLRPGASPDAVAAAYRGLAKRLHPDVPGTGDAAAFMRVREAYAVLSDPLARARYDGQGRDGADSAIWGRRRGARDGVGAWATAHAGEGGADDPGVRPIVARRPVLWLSLSGVVRLVVFAAILAGVAVGVRTFRARQPPDDPVVPRMTAGPEAARDSGAPQEDPGPSAAGTRGTPYYVLPEVGDAVFWTYVPALRHYRPAGALAPFATLARLRLAPHSGMAEVRLDDGRTGYVQTRRLAAGTGADAHRAACIFNAGLPPRNGEALRGGNPAGAPAASRPVAVHNAGDLPAVFALRTDGGVAQAVYVDPGATVTLAAGGARYVVEYAVGDLWSRACFAFSAGMRTERLPGDGPLASAYTIPDPGAVDIPDLGAAAPAR